MNLDWEVQESRHRQAIQIYMSSKQEHVKHRPWKLSMKEKDRRRNRIANRAYSFEDFRITVKAKDSMANMSYLLIRSNSMVLRKR